MICSIWCSVWTLRARTGGLRTYDMRKVFEDAIGGAPAAQKEIVGLIRQLSQAACARGGPATADVEWEDVAQDACRRFF